MPLGATYCHSGPSWPNSQLRHVLPLSVDRPQPLPTVPYQTWPLGPNANPLMKLNEIECALVSRTYFWCSQVCAPRRSTKMPSPYVPTHTPESGARANASTCTPNPVLSGSWGTCWAPAGGDARASRRLAIIADCGFRIADWQGEAPSTTVSSDLVDPFRNPHSAIHNRFIWPSNPPETIGSRSHPPAPAGSPPTPPPPPRPRRASCPCAW